MSAIEVTMTAPDVAAMLGVAGVLARKCQGGDCILLRGDLGAGKTTFARGFIQALRPQERHIISPTFALVQAYGAPPLPTLWHFDLYRLKHEEEAQEIGLEEALDGGITLIEWPERLQNRLPDTALEVTIAIADHEGGRILTFAGPPAWEERLHGLTELVHA